MADYWQLPRYLFPLEIACLYPWKPPQFLVEFVVIVKSVL
jgi:hypothetical protein